MTKCLPLLALLLLESCYDRAATENGIEQRDDALISNDSGAAANTNESGQEEKERRKLEGVNLLMAGAISDDEFLQCFDYHTISDLERKRLLIMIVGQMFGDQEGVVSHHKTPFLFQEVKRHFPEEAASAEDENGDISGMDFISLVIPARR